MEKRRKKALGILGITAACMIVMAVRPTRRNRSRISRQMKILRILCWQRQPGRTERRPMWRIMLISVKKQAKKRQRREYCPEEQPQKFWREAMPGRRCRPEKLRVT